MVDLKVVNVIHPEPSENISFQLKGGYANLLVWLHFMVDEALLISTKLS
jgi:hypothetical protein